ncbi:INO80 complex subunit Ies4 [Aspergillus sclerotialis]|uniref:INO80 complex subunit Ies4 n=1 Tax=Aspergillus sclerotialis TaxID=2070753 RepID=A0A3A2ZRP2_9EURO|nr:INO80 complex subunit Ies4 [Aspergillus sclerotialis]
MPTPTSANSSATNGRRSSRSGPSKAMVVLKLSPKLLSRFANPNEKGKNNSSSPPKIKEPSPASSSPSPTARPSSVDNASDTVSTPATGPAADSSGRKSGQASKAGTKRTFNQASESTARSRGRPGSRKKPKLEDGSSDQPKPAHTSHRLGPKANTGAINAQLRALDRSGAPCRRWERKPLQLKSFTGVQWQLPSWRAPKAQKVEANGEAKEVTLETGDSDSKANNSVSGVPSEKSHSGDGDITPVPQQMAGSPSPAIAMAA